MSTQSIFASADVRQQESERAHRTRVLVSYAVAIVFVTTVMIKGFAYYTLDLAQRPHSPLHAAFKPSGAIGLKLGIVGICCFLVIFLYPLRKRWAWLKRQGSSRHWLDFHVLLGLAAPFIIAFHASFKFRGFAGMAFWIMLSVSISGVVGRYLYGQIPRRVNSTELSLKEARDSEQELVLALSQQHLFEAPDLAHLFKLRSEEQISHWPLIACLIYMVALDLARPFHVARLRLRCLSTTQMVITLGGLLSSNNEQLEAVIGVAREQASLSKRLLLLSRAQRVFHLWHVVHRPFSYTFVVLVVLHIVVVTMMGFM